jgi:ribokinase
MPGPFASEAIMVPAQVVVVGSLNMDLVARAPRLPNPGETLIGRWFSTSPGGKGANQAVAAARLGAPTAMIGCVGEDDFGTRLRSGLESDGIDCRAVHSWSGPSGVALIVVGDEGANGIVVVPGANGVLSPADVDRHEALIAAARVVALQLETPLATVAHAARRAQELRKTVILNPSPAQQLPPGLVADADYLVANEIEAGMLSGIAVRSAEQAMEAGQALRVQGARAVLVTLGEDGVVAVTSESARHYPARPVKAVDSTGAGDTFIGALCAALAWGRTLPDAIDFAQAAAAISVTRPGAQPSIPYAREMVPG